MVRDTGCTLVSLRETKLDLVEVVEETLGSDFVRNFALLPAQGTQGGSFTAVHENFCGLSDAEFRTNLSVSVQGLQQQSHFQTGGSLQCMCHKKELKSLLS